jgi:hypothetical protein
MFTIKFPNVDTMMGSYTVCSKEVMLQAWLDKLGTIMDFTDKDLKPIKVKIVSVNVTEDEIVVELRKE